MNEPLSSIPARPGRRWEIDALRGLMLVLMTFTHLPTRWSDSLSQPFGFVSAAEGFVLLSAYMAGLVYSGRQQREGAAGMSLAFAKRAGKIYLVQAGMLLFMFTVIAGIGVMFRQEAVIELLTFFLEQPFTAFWSGLLLLYNPPMLDILPMYIVFICISPLLLLAGSAVGWGSVIACSLLLWFGGYLGLGAYAHQQAATFAHVPVPMAHAGAFGLFSWQLLWVIGLWMGMRQTSGQVIAGRFPQWMVVVAVAYASIAFVWRHLIGQVPAPHAFTWLNIMFDKWELGPMRLINLMALVLIVMHFGPHWVSRIRGMRFLEVLGAASLPVFSAQIIVTLIAKSLVGNPTAQRPIWIDAAVMVLSFPVLYLVAWISSRPKAKIISRAGWTRPLTR